MRSEKYSSLEENKKCQWCPCYPIKWTRQSSSHSYSPLDEAFSSECRDVTEAMNKLGRDGHRDWLTTAALETKRVVVKKGFRCWPREIGWLGQRSSDVIEFRLHRVTRAKDGGTSFTVTETIN